MYVERERCKRIRKRGDIPYQLSAVKLANLKKQHLVNQVVPGHQIVLIYSCTHEKGKKSIQQKFSKVIGSTKDVMALCNIAEV